MGEFRTSTEPFAILTDASSGTTLSAEQKHLVYNDEYLRTLLLHARVLVNRQLHVGDEPIFSLDYEVERTYGNQDVSLHVSVLQSGLSVRVTDKEGASHPLGSAHFVFDAESLVSVDDMRGATNYVEHIPAEKIVGQTGNRWGFERLYPTPTSRRVMSTPLEHHEDALLASYRILSLLTLPSSLERPSHQEDPMLAAAS